MPKYTIGDVVTLSTHPYSEETNNIVISGEYQLIPPLLVVIEVIENNGDSSEGISSTSNYKCLWFSSKEALFKESYLLETDLKKTALNKDPKASQIKVGDLVGLNTLSTELGKKRSFLNTETQKYATKRTSSVTSLLTYISPVMQTIEVKIFDPTKDRKSLPKVKGKISYPNEIVKCKWFNSVSEKFSEAWIPMDALTLLPKVPHKLLALVAEAIEDATYIKLENTIIRPIQISNRSGMYHLECFDYVSQQNETIPFEQLKKSKITSKVIKAVAPVFKKRKVSGSEVLKRTLTVRKLIKNALVRSTQNYISIKYQDKLGNVTNRTISKYKLILGDGDLEDDGSQVMYVNAQCHLRDDERNFRLDSILEATELNLKCP